MKDTKRALRRHLAERIKWRRLKFDMRDHGIPPRDYDPQLADWYLNAWREHPFGVLRAYRFVCDCFHDRTIQGKARSHAVHFGYGRGCREAYDKEYWGGERFRVRLELLNWHYDCDDPAPSIHRHSSRWLCA